MFLAIIYISQAFYKKSLFSFRERVSWWEMSNWTDQELVKKVRNAF